MKDIQLTLDLRGIMVEKFQTILHYIDSCFSDSLNGLDSFQSFSNRRYLCDEQVEESVVRISQLRPDRTIFQLGQQFFVDLSEVSSIRVDVSFGQNLDSLA